MKKSILIVFLFLMLSTSAFCQSSVSDEFLVPENITYLTGDSWDQGGVVVRLYGISACRGNNFSANLSFDCNDAAKVFLAALVQQGRPKCRGVYQNIPSTLYLSVCNIAINDKIADLGMSLILSGYALAGKNKYGKPLISEYLDAEIIARKNNSGLWRYVNKP